MSGFLRCLRPANMVAACMLLACLSLSTEAQAEVTLSTRIIQGGLDLDFGRVEAGRFLALRELELSMANSGGDQYRLYQEVSGFLVNERGVRLPEGAIVFQISQGSAGSPSSGSIMPLAESPQELYVSNSSGSADTLVVAYSIADGASSIAGNYRGALRFTVESRQTGARTTAIVNIRLTIAPAVSLERLPATASQLRFEQAEPGKRSAAAELLFKINNNAAGPVTLMQELIEPLSGSQGQYFPAEGLSTMAASSQGATAWQAVAGRPERILSDDQGALGEVRLAYSVSAPKDQRAGLYRGKVRIRLLGAQGATADEWIVPIELQVREVFNVAVAIIDGADSMHFRRDAGGAGTTEHVMKVTVTTNVGKPYQVLGGLDHPLVLPSGETIPAAAMTWWIEQASQGKPLIAPHSPVAIGLEPIYQSDPDGSSQDLLLHYQMAIPDDARAGTYSGRLHFTVTVF